MGILRSRTPVAAKMALPTAGARPTFPVSPAPAEGKSFRSRSTISICGVSLKRGRRYCGKRRIQDVAIGKEHLLEERAANGLHNGARQLVFQAVGIDDRATLPSLYDAANAQPFSSGIDGDLDTSSHVAALFRAAGNAESALGRLIACGPSQTFPQPPGRPRGASRQ